MSPIYFIIDAFARKQKLENNFFAARKSEIVDFMTKYCQQIPQSLVGFIEMNYSTIVSKLDSNKSNNSLDKITNDMIVEFVKNQIKSISQIFSLKIGEKLKKDEIIEIKGQLESILCCLIPKNIFDQSFELIVNPKKSITPKQPSILMFSSKLKS